MATPPTRSGYAATSYLAAGAGGGPYTKTATVTVAVGDLLSAAMITEDGSTTTIGTMAISSSGGGVTWTQRQVSTTTQYTGMSVWTGVATVAGSVTVTFSINGGGGSSTAFFGGEVTVWSNHGGVGTSSLGRSVTTGAPSLAMTTSANSAVCVSIGDWSAIDGTTRTWRTVNGAAATETLYQRNTTNYATYGGYHPDSGAAGSVTFGMTTPSTMTWTMGLVEILPAAPAIGQVVNLVATPVSTTQINLTWDAVTGATGYEVERNGTTIAYDVGTNAYSDTGLTVSTTYAYRVRAIQD